MTRTRRIERRRRRYDPSCNSTLIWILVVVCVVAMDESDVQRLPTPPDVQSRRQTSTTAWHEVENPFLPDVVGGTEVKLGDYPSFAVSTGIFACAGALIWPDVIVTVASCSFGPLELINAIFYYIGGTQSDGSDALATATVKKLIPHPSFKDAAQDDIMLVFLNAPVPTSKVPLAKWNTNASLPLVNSTTNVLGLGCLRLDSTPRSLFQAKVAVANFSTCSDAFKKTDLKANQTICSTDDTKGPCLGSYGGPMLDPRNNNTLLGLVSIGTTGRRPALANVYTRLSAYTDWIQETICQNSIVTPPTSSNNTTCVVQPTPSPPSPLPPTTRDDCTPPPRNCVFWNSIPGTLLRRSLLGSCSDICSPLPWVSMALGWRCGQCQDDR